MGPGILVSSPDDPIISGSVDLEVCRHARAQGARARVCKGCHLVLGESAWKGRVVVSGRSRDRLHVAADGAWDPRRLVRRVEAPPSTRNILLGSLKVLHAKLSSLSIWERRSQSRCRHHRSTRKQCPRTRPPTQILYPWTMSPIPCKGDVDRRFVVRGRSAIRCAYK